MKDILRGFTVKQLGETLNLFAHLSANGKTVEYLRKYVERHLTSPGRSPDRLLQAWLPGQVSEALDIYDRLIANGRTIEALRHYKEGLRTLKDVYPHIVLKRRPVLHPPKRKCPSCGRIMKLIQVSNHPVYKSKFVCHQGCGSCNAGGGCGYVDFSEKPFKDWFEEERP